MQVIWVRREWEYFCKGGWTGKSLFLKSLAKEQGDLILRSASSRVSKDGERNGVAAILRDARKSGLLRMRAEHDAGVFHFRHCGASNAMIPGATRSCRGSSDRSASIVRLIAPDRRQPVAMGFADEPPIYLQRANTDTAVHRQIAIEARHRHRHAPASVVGDYRVREQWIEHSGSLLL
jgi:hypothetical protein